MTLAYAFLAFAVLGLHHFFLARYTLVIAHRIAHCMRDCTAAEALQAYLKCKVLPREFTSFKSLLFYKSIHLFKMPISHQTVPTTVLFTISSMVTAVFAFPRNYSPSLAFTDAEVVEDSALEMGYFCSFQVRNCARILALVGVS